MTDTVNPLWAGDTAAPPIDREALETWLRAKGMTDKVAVVQGPSIPTSDPGAMLVVTWMGGPGFSLEQLLDTPAFQVRTIGPQGNYDLAGQLAEDVDRAFTRHGWGDMIGRRWVVEVRRAGGRPSLDRVDDADRAHYVCTYLADIEADERNPA